MKTSSITRLLPLALLTGTTTAFWGQLTLTDQCGGEGGCLHTLLLRDYNTGSTWDCQSVWPSCTAATKCTQSCRETSPGSYNFKLQYWQTSDGCQNVDFMGALDAHHGWCCGGTPCDISA